MITLLTARLPEHITVTTPDDPELTELVGLLVIVGGGAGTPSHRRILGAGTTRRTVWRVVCVANTISAATQLAGLVCDAVDGAIINGALATVRYVSDPIEDRADPTEWRWSSTVEATHY